jgi:hypothetical protein
MRGCRRRCGHADRQIDAVVAAGQLRISRRVACAECTAAIGVAVDEHGWWTESSKRCGS